jgi:O-antigen/teichoic acid export membrane protein
LTTARLDQASQEGGRSGSHHMIRSAQSLMLNTVLGAALGLVFWFAAARLYASDQVGRDSALITSMISLCAFCTLNLQNLLLRFLPSRPHPARAVLGAYGIAALATTAGAVALVVIMPAVSDEFEMFSARPAVAVIYVAGAVAWTLFALQDAALTALRKAAWVPVKNTTYYALKLVALLPLAAIGATHGVLVAWLVPVIAMLLPVNLLMFRRVIAPHARDWASGDERATGETITRRAFLRFAAQDSAGGLLNLAALTLLPLLVVALLGSAANAYFFIPFTIVVTFDLLFLNVAASLVAEGARDEAALPVLVRSIVRRFFPPLLVGVGVLLVAAPLILAPFGAEYARQGTGVLRLMALASVFRATLALFVALSRLQRRGGAILAAQLTFSVLLVSLIFVLADRRGLEGVALAWLCATAVVAIAVLPGLVRYVRAARVTTPGEAPQAGARTATDRNPQ